MAKILTVSRKSNHPIETLHNRYWGSCPLLRMTGGKESFLFSLSVIRRLRSRLLEFLTFMFYNICTTSFFFLEDFIRTEANVRFVTIMKVEY